MNGHPDWIATAYQHARARLQQEELRAAIAAGLASGPGQSANAVFDRLEAKYRKQSGKRAALG